MPAKVRSLPMPALLMLAGLSTGCHSTHRPVNQYDEDGVNGSVAVIANDLVVLDLPVVRVNKGTIYVLGSLHRKTTGDALPGRVDIEFLGPGGEYLDGLPALLTPRAVPGDPGTPANYSTSYGYVPPSGSTVRVHFVDRDTQVLEDLNGNDFSYSPGGRGTGEHPNANTPHHNVNGGGGGGEFGGGSGKHGM